MKKLVFILTLVFFAGCAKNHQIRNYEIRGNLAVTESLSCISAIQITRVNTAADIVSGARECVSVKNYDGAAELIMVASAYAYFDTQRVTDKTSHGAFNALLAKEFFSFPEYERVNVKSSVSMLEKNAIRKQIVCKHLIANGSPTYIPTYMIAHGMEMFNPERGHSLDRDFNERKSWEKSLEFVNCHS